MGRSRSRSPRGGRGGGDDEHRIQKLVDERLECRRSRDFDRADQIRDDLRGMGVQVDDSDNSWRGPGGLSGTSANGGGKGGGGGGGVQRRDGDWDCNLCGKMNFANREACFSCSAPREEDRGRGRGRSPDRYDDRRFDDRGSRYDDRRGGGGRCDSRSRRRGCDRDERRCDDRRDCDRRRRDDSRGGGRRYR